MTAGHRSRRRRAPTGRWRWCRPTSTTSRASTRRTGTRSATRPWPRGSGLPKEAIVGRLGGDEYAVALPDHSAETALIVFEEIRAHFTEHPFGPALNPRLSVSVGIASRPPHATETGALLRAADEALARAKREGRSRVAIFVEEKMTLKSNYYSRAQLDRLTKLSGTSGRTEASLLREALDDLFAKYKD